MERVRPVPRNAAMLERKPGRKGGAATPRPGRTESPGAGKGFRGAFENEPVHPRPVTGTRSFPDSV